MDASTSRHGLVAQLIHERIFQAVYAHRRWGLPAGCTPVCTVAGVAISTTAPTGP